MLSSIRYQQNYEFVTVILLGCHAGKMRQHGLLSHCDLSSQFKTTSSLNDFKHINPLLETNGSLLCPLYCQ